MCMCNIMWSNIQIHSVYFTNQSLFRLFLSCLFLDSDQKKLNKRWFPSTRRRTDEALGMFVSLVRPRQTGRSQPTVQLPAPQRPLPLRNSSPSASIWARLVLHFSEDCCVCVYSCSDTKTKRTRQYLWCLFILMCLCVLKKTVAVRSLKGHGKLFLLHFDWMCHIQHRKHARVELDYLNRAVKMQKCGLFPDGFLWLIWRNLAWLYIDLLKKKNMFTILQNIQSLTGFGKIAYDWLPFRCICQLGILTNVLLLTGKIHPLLLLHHW